MNKLIAPILIIFGLLLGCFNSEEEVDDFKVVLANEEIIKKIKAFQEVYEVKSVTVKAERYSKTNVQVPGVDEADIVKCDGEHIYYSKELIYRIFKIGYPLVERTYIIKAYPPNNLTVLSNISKGGKLYYFNKSLIIIGNREMYAYNVSNPKDPKLIWNLTLNGSYVSSRFYKGDIYLVVRKHNLNYPIVWNNVKAKLYVPLAPSYYDLDYSYTYIISKINGRTGKVKNLISLAAGYKTNMYMSKNNLYFTYYLAPKEYWLYINFIYKYRDKYFPKDVAERIKEVYEDKLFDPYPKYIQIRKIINSYLSSLPLEERNRLMEEIEEGFNKYLEENIEKLEGTGILKINLNNFSMVSTKIPGKVLNQFSMDEYEGYFRIATTIGDIWRLREKTKNSIYILDKDLKVVGKIENISKGKRIYAVRFVKDRAYIITYREKDPLYVVDLKNLRILGELKIEGYSTYLHPIGKDKIIGIGKDNGRIKISLYDVSNFSSPKELDKFIIDEFWSRALYEHHAFFWDGEKRILVIPVGKKAYVFKINNNNISLKFVDVHNSEVLRALYIDDYLYIISYNELHVVDENNFKLVNKISL